MNKTLQFFIGQTRSINVGNKLQSLKMLQIEILGTDSKKYSFFTQFCNIFKDCNLFPTFILWDTGNGQFWVIGILYHKEHPPEVWHIPPGTPCILVLCCSKERVQFYGFVCRNVFFFRCLAVLDVFVCCMRCTLLGDWPSCSWIKQVQGNSLCRNLLIMWETVPFSRKTLE
jgi:hypothetical protein